MALQPRRTVTCLDVLVMSHKETGSVPLSYRCSHEHRSLTQLSCRVSSSLSPPSPRSEESVSDSMTRSQTLVLASTSSLSAPLATAHCRGNNCRKRRETACSGVFTEVWSEPRAQKETHWQKISTAEEHLESLLYASERISGPPGEKFIASGTSVNLD